MNDTVTAAVLPTTQPTDETDLELSARVSFQFRKGDGRPPPFGADDECHVTGLTIMGVPVDVPDALARRLENLLLSEAL